ncbi:MAG: tryptophan 7-halogenase [Acidobacteriota bacterium]
MQLEKHYDVVILGAGLAGLSLCRHLTMANAGKKILLLDNKTEVPGKKQKVGESLVQVGGYYFSKVLDLEEHLFNHHYLKYNLRFYWKTTSGDRNFEEYSQSYIRPLSNVCSYQLDRNVLEAHILSENIKHPDVTFCHPAVALDVRLAESGPHTVRFKLGEQDVSVTGEWVVDTSGRGQFLKRRHKLQVESDIRHGSSWCWVDGLVNIEKLTDMPLAEIRKKADRREQGFIPLWLATNHFMGKGFWFWVIPLQGLTSLGLVYEREQFDENRVSTPEKLIQWACEEFPLFQRDLPNRRILDAARLLSYAYDCRQTISPSKWGMAGMAGRFTDPLYSPGSDLISLYNSMLVDSILSKDQEELNRKCEIYEPLMKIFYEAYVPSYAVSYNALGDQEVFSLKYSWELAIYFSFYVFPFISDFFTNRDFIQIFFRKFAQLGPINRNLQHFLSAYYEWKRERALPIHKVLFDFFELTPLKYSETAFYEVGLTVPQAEEVLDRHLDNLREFARFIYAYIVSRVIGEDLARFNRSFIEALKLRELKFDPTALKAEYEAHRGCTENYVWKLDAEGMRKFDRIFARDLVSA